VMRSTSKEIIRISTEEEDLRDYSTLVDTAYFNLTRTDEVGLLASDYYDIVCLLHYGAEEKKNTPKYPLNPFHLDDIEVLRIIKSPSHGGRGSIASEDLVEVMRARELSIALMSNVDDCPNTSSSEEEDQQQLKSDGEVQLSEAASLSSRKYYRQLDVREEDGASVSRLTDATGRSLHDIEGGTDFQQLMSPPVDQSQCIPAGTVERRSLPSRLAAIKSRIRTVGTFTSIKSQLYVLSALLLFGLTVAMVITVTLVNTQGKSWTDESSSDLGE